MVTTIQVNESTLVLLKYWRKTFGFSSYDELLNTLVKRQTQESLYGFLGHSSRENILRDLRDKSDRF